ncbi:MAG TPA: hypothetical protein VMP01_08410 [Pirellulaceae bacterium]|nr:hypothetical protein [Pirellulaceae bacterium]
MHSNPFATRFTRPGALAFLFPAGQSAESIVSALAQAQWWGQILGPHGSGKSTLLAALMPELARQGRDVVHLVFRSGPAPGSSPPVAGSWTSQTQVVVDGYEQLSWWNRRNLKRACRKTGAGLLLTAHRPCGLATLFQTKPTVELAEQIVRQLLAADDQTITTEDIREVCRQHPTNLREVLFGLYDLYQRRMS